MDVATRVTDLIKDRCAPPELWCSLWNEACMLYTPQGSHGLEHILAVCKNVAEVSDGSSVATDVASIATAAAALHDVGRAIGDGSNHAARGYSWLLERMAAQQLQPEEASYWSSVGIAIDRHSSHERCSGPAEKLLWDADKLDLLGWSGLTRMSMRCGELGGTRVLPYGRALTEELRKKVLELHPDRFFYAAARSLAAQNYGIIVEACDALEHISVSWGCHAAVHKSRTERSH